jgi:PAS domain S-box-containing protein
VQWSLRNVALLGFGLAALLLVNAGLSYRSLGQVAKAERLVAHTHEVLDVTSDVLSTLKDAETGQRGFLITGQDNFLEPYHDALARLNERLAKLQDLTRDNARQQAHIQELEKRTAVRLTLLAQGIDLRRKGSEEAQAFIATAKGKEQMDAIRTLVAEMEQEEQGLLRVRADESGRCFVTALALLAFTTLLGLGLVGLASYLVRRDLTGRERAAAVLHEQRERFQTTLASIGDAVIVTDVHGVVTFLNAVAQALTGWQDDAVGRKLDDVFPIVDEKTRQPAANPVPRAIQEGGVVGLANHTVLIARDGTEIPIDDSAAPIRDAKGRIVGVVLIFRDITARRRDEQELRQWVNELAEAEGRIRSVVDTVLDGIITIDESGVIESFNPAAARLFGYHPSQVLGQNVKLLMPEPYHSEHDGYLANYLRTGQAKIIGIGREVVGRRKDGSTFPMDLAVSAFRLGKRRFFTGVVRDITERKKLEQELRQHAGELAEADRRKNEFLAMLAHELRNPLAPIRHAVQLQRLKDPVEPELQLARDVIDRQVQQLTRLVDDLLDLSRISRGKINLQLEPVDLAAVVARAVEISRPLIDARKQRLEVSLPEQAVPVEGDLTRLVQVVSNLLNNAAKYTEEDGRIWLTVGASTGDGVIRVRDTGVGISPEMLPRLFEMFSQVQGSVSRSEGGLGIGLSLVRSLVDLHGGNVQAFSEGLGRGSEFVVRLPLVQGAVQPAAAGSAPERPRTVPARRILVIDDNQDAAESLSLLLRLTGQDVQTAYDGPTALDAARALPPDVVLCDIGLPRMNGLEVARRLRQDLGLTDALLIALTGYGMDEDKCRSQEAGFNAHLVKPVDLDALYELLDRARA